MYKLVVGSLVLLFIFSCTLKDKSVMVADVDMSGWNTTQLKHFRYQNEDTVSSKILTIMVRCSKNYSKDKINVVLSLTTPDGVMWSDTVSVGTKVDLNQKRVNAMMRQYEAVITDKVLFANKGSYIFSLSPVEDNTKDISAIGVIISK